MREGKLQPCLRHKNRKSGFGFQGLYLMPKGKPYSYGGDFQPFENKEAPALTGFTEENFIGTLWADQQLIVNPVGSIEP
ncbi:MAG: hypothetical protein ACU826_03660 [Gammaproteobacteria bacterium]